jgi:Flp pilus assembly protein TadG
MRKLSKNNRWKGLLAETRGQATVEFAIAIFTIFFMVFWIWEATMALYTANVLADAAKEGVRYAVVHGNTSCFPSGGATTQGSSCTGLTTPTLCDGTTAATAGDSTGANVKATVTCYAKLSLHNVSAMTINVTYPDATNNPSDRVRVTISYTYVPFVAVPWVNPQLRAAAEGEILY